MIFNATASNSHKGIEIFFSMSLINALPKVTLKPAVTINCVSNEILSFEWKFINIEIADNTHESGDTPCYMSMLL